MNAKRYNVTVDQALMEAYRKKHPCGNVSQLLTEALKMKVKPHERRDASLAIVARRRASASRITG